ncbi:pyrimidine reductase family protein [Microbacter sp. GSS18]|nr:pyrimidine reductase family protein [Microbacter sp. GSS18]
MPTVTELLDAYAVGDRTAPAVRMNFVASADGAVTLDGRSGALGGDTDRTLMGVLRALSDVVLVGAGTIRSEGYGGMRVDDELAAWRVRHGMPPQPRLAIVTGSADLDPALGVFADAVTTPIVVTSAHAPLERRHALDAVADVLVCGERGVDLALMRSSLAERGLPGILCEGGPGLFGALVAVGLVDELCLTLSPTLAGGDAGRILRGAPAASRPLRLLHAIADDDGFVFLRYAAATSSASRIV